MKLKNVAKLLLCLGPVLCGLAYLIADYFAHSPTDEPTTEKAAFYENAAIFCVTLFFSGGLIFVIGAAISSYLLARKFIFRSNK